MKLVQILLIISNILKTAIFGSLAIAEIGCLTSGNEYRFQYLFILYFIIPGLIIFGTLELIGLMKLNLQRNFIVTFSFIIGGILLILMNNEFIVNPIKLSWAMIFTFTFGIILSLIAIYKIVKSSKIKKA